MQNVGSTFRLQVVLVSKQNNIIENLKDTLRALLTVPLSYVIDKFGNFGPLVSENYGLQYQPPLKNGPVKFVQSSVTQSYIARFC